MSYAVNHYNYATPPSSAPELVGDYVSGVDGKFLILTGNTLDGTWHPIQGDVGLWGASLSDADGYLSEPLIITVPVAGDVNALRIIGSASSYPVSFEISFYSNDGVVISTITVVSNASTEWTQYLPQTINCDHYEIKIDRISAANSVAKVLNVHTPHHVMRRIDARLTVAESAYSTGVTHALDRDTVSPSVTDEVTSMLIDCPVSVDEPLSVTETTRVRNVHTVMREPSRHVYGKVEITYTDPMLAVSTAVEATSEAYNSNIAQVLDNETVPAMSLFKLYDNDLSGKYHPASAESQVGWTSAVLSDATGNFATPQSIKVSFSARPIVSLTVYFNTSAGCTVEDCTVAIARKDGSIITLNVVGNTEPYITIKRDDLIDVTSVTLSVIKVSKPYFPASVLDIPVLSTLLYVGYQDKSELISMDILEELTYDDTVEALGGVSANEVTVVLDNSTHEFYFNNPMSRVASQLLRNRKIVPWLGVEIIPGTVEWYRMGTYWSYSWKVPVGGLTATVVGFDTLGLLDLTSFTDHQVMKNTSIGDLIDFVLFDARKALDFLEWRVDEALYDVIIPYAWFDAGSHTNALRKISKSYPMHTYCDRDGRICAAVNRRSVDNYFDAWADSTNVISKAYNSLYTTVPNLVNVTVAIPKEVAGENLVSDVLVFSVDAVQSRTLKFNKPYLSDLHLDIDKDASVSFTYSLYSWGIVFNFTGTGSVRSITCTGTAVDISNTALLTRRDEESIALNGAVTRDISADFIQTGDLGAFLLNRFFELSSNDIYDVDVAYRGDIALTIGDPVLLVDGIAPDNRYTIRRHELSWNGALTGRADLNT